LKTTLAASLLSLIATTASANDGPRIVAVNYALQYLAERLAGEGAEVIFPVPDGVDPSFWRPSISDISTVQSADLILLNGAGFATWVDRVSLPRSKLVNTSAAFRDQYIVTESITHSHGEGDEHSHDATATYVWLDPMLAIEQAGAIAAALSAKGLAPADDVFARFDDLRTELEGLDEAAQEALAALSGAPIIATHPRYHYLARRYDLSISSLEWEAGAMPTTEDISTLEALVQDTGAQLLLWEAQPPADAIELAAALGLTSVVFPPLAQSTDADFLATFAASVEAMGKALPKN